MLARPREAFLADPAGPRRQGLPRADTPRPGTTMFQDVADLQLPALIPVHDIPQHEQDPGQQQPAAPQASTDAHLKRVLAMRSPAAKATPVVLKKARTSHTTATAPSVPDVFSGPAASIPDPPFSTSTPLTRSIAIINPADVPLPASMDNTPEIQEEDVLFDDTEPKDNADGRDDAAAQALLALSEQGPTGTQGTLVLAPGSLAAQVAGTDDVLPSAKDAFVYTAIPADGPPEVNAASPRWLFQNLDVAQIVLWENIPGGKLFTTIFGAGGADHLIDKDLYATVASIRTELTRLTGITSLRVTPPDPAVRPSALNSPPYGFLVHGISESDAQRLLTMGFLSTARVSILFFAFAVTYPTIMANFMFISDKSNDEVRHMVVSLLRRPENRSKILDLIALKPGSRSPTQANTIARDLIKSARVTSTPRTGKGGTPTPVFNLYIDAGPITIDEWKRWKAFFTTLHWHDAEFGTLGLHDDVFCPGCRGADHYRWACPFMAIDGWKGTMPKAQWRGALPDNKQIQGKPGNGAGVRKRNTKV